MDRFLDTLTLRNTGAPNNIKEYIFTKGFLHNIQLLHDNCETVTLEPESYDALLSDPPYGLEFMGNAWDKVVPPAKTWKHIAAALKPGAQCIIFGGPRTFDLLTAQLRLAGLEIRDVLCWLYAAGMPKSKATLKPAWEPIILARKPLKQSIKLTNAAYGTGLLNIDECRIGQLGFPKGTTPKNNTKNAYGDGLNGGNKVPTAGGRWPSNVLLDEEAAEHLDNTSGKTVSRLYKANVAEGSVLPLKKRTAGGYTDEGGASRYFWVAKASKADRNIGLPKGTNNPHPTCKPTKLAEYLAKLIMPQNNSAPRLLVPFSGSGSEIIGANRAGWNHITGIELDNDYIQLAKQRLGIQ